jgi:hypothetical protein
VGRFIPPVLPRSIFCLHVRVIRQRTVFPGVRIVGQQVCRPRMKKAAVHSLGGGLSKKIFSVDGIKSNMSASYHHEGATARMRQDAIHDCGVISLGHASRRAAAHAGA